MDEEVKADYGEFTAAVATINSLNSKLETGKENIESSKTSLESGEILEGPVADSTQGELANLLNLVSLTVDNFNTMGKKIITISQNYNAADASAQQQIFIIKEDGKVDLIDRPIYVNENASASEVEFINQILPGALDLYNKYGILPSLTLGQAAHESGWGNGDSLFGIKATSGWKGDVINAGTWEEGSGGAYNTNANFRAYDSVNSAIEDYGEVIKDSFPKVLDAKDYQSAVEAVQDGKWGKYATDSDYIPKVTNIIEEYNLDQWDPK